LGKNAPLQKASTEGPKRSHLKEGPRFLLWGRDPSQEEAARPGSRKKKKKGVFPNHEKRINVPEVKEGLRNRKKRGHLPIRNDDWERVLGGGCLLGGGLGKVVNVGGFCRTPLHRGGCLLQGFALAVYDFRKWDQKLSAEGKKNRAPRGKRAGKNLTTLCSSQGNWRCGGVLTWERDEGIISKPAKSGKGKGKLTEGSSG